MNADHVDFDDNDDDDAGIFSIANDCHSKDDEALTGEDNVLSAVHKKSSTAAIKDESAEEYLLTREAVVLFVQVCCRCKS
uniref:Uncharacterized protein n=1 Tax=Peronospora matthiolae TaxID=2874970 RepID=A0AAV1TFY7_9STRA